ncbi:hypothetical protein L1987_32829 [Smallanthus sonchifolius]|uniref:Uncharacterized protein n=1 Tax=Smallanthus sonchifolius TaxID=185202 RepID=A0ACB9HQ11_9ASTR|nr:hypothetical protein L1987_32829 [Smallanthus sonchifolius]
MHGCYGGCWFLTFSYLLVVAFFVKSDYRSAKLGMKLEWMEGTVRVIFGPKPAFRSDFSDGKPLPTDLPEMTILRSLMKGVLHYNGERVMFCC